jgi:beta-lactamase regulating signal transducer with metallopeptidase domain/biopolymer transport protein ExbD
LLGAWLTGVVVVIAFAMFRQFRFLRHLSRYPTAANPHLLDTVSRLARLAGLRQPVRTVLMPPGSTPAVVGWRRARLLLPEDWSARFDDSSLRHVLLHELLHVRHRDLLWNWAALIVQAVHWFNPLVWLVVARFQSDRELRCDAGALALLSPNERLAYGHTLLRIQQTFFAPPAIAGLAPCVRNHPTLRQRILMIAEPTRLRPWLQAVFALAFVLLSGYAFTTSAEDEKPLPPKERPRETTRGNNTEPSREATETPRRREGDGAKSGMRDGERSKNAEREGDGARPRSREGDGTKTGARDGERPRNSERDGQRPKTGERDGERPRTGNAERDKPGSQTNPNRREAGPASSETLTIRVSNDGSSVLVDGQELPMNRLRGFLHSYLPDHPGASVVVTGEPDTPYKALTGTMDAVRDNGNKKVSIAAP